MTLVITAPSVAMQFTSSDGTKIDMVPTSGNSIDIDPGTGTVQDIKGYPITSPFYDPATKTTVYLGLGALVSGEAGTQPVIITLNEGPVILNIARATDAPSNIKITWQINTTAFPAYAATTPVDIYYKTGTGVGAYNSTQGYVKVVSSNALVPDTLSGSVNVANKELTISGQVGTGNPELYFKGLITGSDPMAVGDTGLARAVAVGKMNINLVKGYSFVSMPFILSNGNAVSQAFAKQLDLDTVEIYHWDEATQTSPQARYYASPSPGEWKFLPPGASFYIEQGFSYWVKMPAATTVTLMGKVSNAAFAKAINKQQYSTLGNAFPLSRTFDSVLPADDQYELYWYDGVRGILPQMKRDAASGQWKTVSPGEPVFGLTPVAGYWFNNKKTTDIPWSQPSP